MQTISKFSLALFLVAVLAFVAPPAALATTNGGQVDTTSTTLSGAVSPNVTAQWCLASATGVVLPSLSGSTSGSMFVVDKEAVQVTSQGSSSTCYNVKRGQLGTSANWAHASGATVWVGGAAIGSGDNSRPFTGVFTTYPPVGPCTASLQYSLPVVVTGTPEQIYQGQIYYCTAGVWTAGFSQFYQPKLYSAFTTFAPPTAITNTSTSQIAGDIWFSQLDIPVNTTVTGACVLNGATVGTNKWIVALYDGSGALIANSDLAGTTTATASKYQCIAFTATRAIQGPGTYFLAAQTNGTTDNFQTYAANGAPTNYGTNNKTGAFGTLTAITPTTTFAADKGPIGFVY